MTARGRRVKVPLPPAGTDLSSDRDRRLLIAGAVIGFGIALYAVTITGACLLAPAPALWQILAAVAVCGSVVYAGVCALPEDFEDAEDDS
jgi:hypothetical protein